MRSVSVIANCGADKVWNVYQQLKWNEWDHDILKMSELEEGKGLVDGAQVTIEMKKDGKVHCATVKDVCNNKCFTYTAPLPGSTLEAIQTLEALGDGTTRITHSFAFTGVMGCLYQCLTRSYVQNGLETNTAALKTLAEDSSITKVVP